MSGEGQPPKGGGAERGEPISPLPWPKDCRPGWPDRLPWPPMVAPGARGQKLCVEACMKAGGTLEACAIICAILDALPAALAAETLAERCREKRWRRAWRA